MTRISNDEDILLTPPSVSQHCNPMDIESADRFFDNISVESFSWKNVSLTVKSKDGPKSILHDCEGYVAAGQVLALMGPSGSGKTTLLNVLANRSRMLHTGSIFLNGSSLSPSSIRQVSGYLEQEDVNIGGLTVGESLDFTIRLASPELKKLARIARCEQILQSLGLWEQRSTVISSPFRKGISSGQKRRLSLAVALVTGPKILFLDEPTSGLDSKASHEVMTFISKLARKHRLIVVAAIHQPSTATFDLFDSVLLLSKGYTCYMGPQNQIGKYFNKITPIPPNTNIAEAMLDFVNTDFRNNDTLGPTLTEWVERWRSYDRSQLDIDYVRLPEKPFKSTVSSNLTVFRAIWILLHRNAIKSYRDPLAYGTRLVMTTLLSIVIGTVWYRLPYTQTSIIPWTNCVFFSGAFMSLMGVAYVPAVIEDIRMLQKEFSNRLYGPCVFTLANFIIGLPWLFSISVIFSLVVYWLANFNNTNEAFAYFVAWLYFDLLASESTVLLVSALTPQFVTALAIIAVTNGLWLAVGGFLVPKTMMSAFWKYGFHYIDYQTYVFQGIMVNQFKNTVYDCTAISTPNGTLHQCMYPSDLEAEGKIRGTAVLDSFGCSYDKTVHWKWMGYLVLIILAHRLLGIGALYFRVHRK